MKTEGLLISSSIVERSVAREETMYITLPSNVCEKGFEGNTNASYTTVLPEPLDAGQGQYEVGLSEIQYTSSWSNVKNSAISFRVKLLTGRVEANTLKLRDGRYKDHKELIHELRRCMKGAKLATDGAATIDLPSTVAVKFSSLANRCAITCTRDDIDVKFIGDLGPILGFEVDTWVELGRQPGRIVRSPNAPDIDSGMTALYVYCDLVASRTVGNSKVRLLRAVTVASGASRQNVMREFKHTHYLPIESGYYTTVEINIYRDNGEKVPFEGGKVIVTLHLVETR